VPPAPRPRGPNIARDHASGSMRSSGCVRVSSNAEGGRWRMCQLACQAVGCVSGGCGVPDGVLWRLGKLHVVLVPPLVAEPLIFLGRTSILCSRAIAARGASWIGHRLIGTGASRRHSAGAGGACDTRCHVRQHGRRGRGEDAETGLRPLPSAEAISEHRFYIFSRRRHSTRCQHGQPGKMTFFT